MDASFKFVTKRKKEIVKKSLHQLSARLVCVREALICRLSIEEKEKEREGEQPRLWVSDESPSFFFNPFSLLKVIRSFVLIRPALPAGYESERRGENRERIIARQQNSDISSSNGEYKYDDRTIN
jgi:hypothetical protein